MFNDIGTPLRNNDTEFVLNEIECKSDLDKMIPADTTEDSQKLSDALLKIELNSAFHFYNNNINKTSLPDKLYNCSKKGSLNKYGLLHLQQDNCSHQDCKELADPKREGNMELSLVLNDHNYISRELTSYLNKFNPHLVNLKQTLLKYLLEGLCELELPSESLNYQGIHRELNYYTNMVLKHFSSFILEKLPIMAYTRECIEMEYNLCKKELHINNSNSDSGRIAPFPRHEILDEVKVLEFAEKLKILFTKYNFFDNDLTIKLSPLSDLGESNLNSNFQNSTKQNELRELSSIENCSEPLEYITCHELQEDINIDVMESENYILQHILNFANQLCEDCEVFKSSKISIRDKILRYIYAKYNEFKTIIKDINIFCEKSIQTENLRKTAYNHSKSENEEITLPSIRTSSPNSDCTLKLNSDYDDCVPLMNYVRSEIFESNETPYKDLISLELDDDIKVQKSALTNDSSTLASVSVDEPNTTNGIDKNSINGENVDREIQRLINLNNLEKKQLSPTNKSSRQLSTEKLENGSEKINVIKDTTVQKEVAADESNLSDIENETFTEEAFLERYNNNLKQQLLRASSSDSESMSNAIDYPLVENFLKNSSDRDTSENEQDGFKKDDKEGLVNNFLTTYKSPVEEEIRACKMLTNNCNNIECSTDCTYFRTDNIRERYGVGSSRKLFRNMDPQTGKTYRYEDNFISLSSESDNSDVEAVDNAFNEVNRIIKPMLRHDQLATETLSAQKLEANRIKRVDEKHSILNNLLKLRPAISQNKNELILDFNADTNTFIQVHPDLAKLLKPHQVEGVKFMYDSCYGGVEMLKKSSGSGCILAHCMGLGKTLQVIALIHTVIAYKELNTTKILVLCPKSTVMNWADEMQRWIGPLNTKNMKLFTFNDLSDINEKLKTLKEWSLSSHEKAGCLLIGYEAFRFLVFYHSYKAKLNKTPLSSDDIRESVNKYLFSPGADLVVCDEGHVIKNRKSAISLAVSKIVTPKRIILTGTPIQNNLKEYYSMVNFIKPLFLGTEKEFANLYANPIKNGQHKDSSKRDIKVMKQRSFVLHKKLSKFVQRKEAKLLKAFLPQKYEYVLFIPMSIVQNNLYEFILDTILKREDNRGRSLITDYTCLRKIWTHPKVLEDAWKNATINKSKKDAKKQHALHSDEDQPDDVYDSQTGIMSVTHDWWRHLVTKSDLETILPSKKIRTMFEILRMCRENGEKCLIFSAFVAVLNVVEYFFKKINEQDPETLKDLNLNHSLHNNSSLSWVLGQDYYRLDGKTPKSLRHEMIKSFNSPLNKKARVFLISAKAGGQGINLIGANRVIILDTSWNPSNDQQNIFRVFRLGQRKNCFIYRLLSMGTMEEKVYSRSVTKQAMSFRVVDEQQIDRHYNMAELAELYTLTKPDYEKRSMPVFPKDNILANLLLNNPDLVYKYHEHDSLLENQVEQELSEQEKSDAWALYERDHNFTTEIQGIPFLDALLFQQLS